jgi:hypothetical protein
MEDAAAVVDVLVSTSRTVVRLLHLSYCSVVLAQTMPRYSAARI